MTGLTIVVKAPANAWQPIRYRLTCPDDARRELARLLRWINDSIVTVEINPAVLLRLTHWSLAVDALLDGLLEMIRREQDWEIEQWWCESYPCTAPPAWPAQDATSSEVAA